MIDHKRFFRYLAPNLVTFASLTFGMASIVSTLQGRWADAAWFVIFSVLTDKLDGFVARLVKGTSELGVQLDSFADFLNFGIAPALLWYSYLSRPDMPVGAGRAVMMGSMGVWVLAVTFRLARYNIVGDDPRCKRIFFGVPTTLMGGLLCALFLSFLKYGADPSGTLVAPGIDEPRLLGDLDLDPGVWALWPALVTLGAVLMASTVKIPKLGLSKSKVLSVFIVVNVFAGYALGASRHFPEYMCFAATLWTVPSIVWGWFNAEARRMHPPPIFPRNEPPPHQVPQRPEEDMVPDEDEAHEHDHEQDVLSSRPL